MTTKTITIQGVTCTVSQPYEAGHAITEAEAKALNQVRAENIRNNTASFVKETRGDAEEFTQEMLDAIAAHVAEYDAKYEFSMASVGAARTTDPLEIEARSIARKLVSEAARAQGIKLKDIDPEALKAKIAEVAANPEVVKEAEKSLKQKQKLASATAVSF